MKHFNKYLSLTLISLFSLTSCAVKSDLCEDPHPHTDKLVIDIQWSAVQKTSTTPSSILLYCWNVNDNQPIITESTPDGNGRCVFELPKPGDYNMMLVGKLKDDYFNLNNENTYQQFNAQISQTPEMANALFAQNLGQMTITDNSTIFLNATIGRYSRNMTVKAVIEDMYFQPSVATLSLTGLASEVSMYQQKYSGSYNINQIPLTVSTGGLATSFTYLKSDGSRNAFTLSVAGPDEQVISRNVDFSKSLQEFEDLQPFSEDLHIEVGVKFTRAHGIFDFNITYITINGSEVYRRIDA